MANPEVSKTQDSLEVNKNSSPEGKKEVKKYQPAKKVEQKEEIKLPDLDTAYGTKNDAIKSPKNIIKKEQIDLNSMPEYTLRNLTKKYFPDIPDPRTQDEIAMDEGEEKLDREYLGKIDRYEKQLAEAGKKIEEITNNKQFNEQQRNEIMIGVLEEQILLLQILNELESSYAILKNDYKTMRGLNDIKKEIINS